MPDIIDYFKRKYEKSKITDFNKEIYNSAFKKYKKAKKQINHEEVLKDYFNARENISPILNNMLLEINNLLINLSNPSVSKQSHNFYAGKLYDLLESCKNSAGFILDKQFEFDVVNGKIISYFKNNGNMFAFSFPENEYLGYVVRESSMQYAKDLNKNSAIKYNVNFEYIFDNNNNSTLSKEKLSGMWFGNTSEQNYINESSIYDMSVFSLDIDKIIDKIQIFPTTNNDIYEIVISKVGNFRNEKGLEVFTEDESQPVLSALVKVQKFLIPIIIGNTIYYEKPMITYDKGSNTLMCYNEIVDNPEYVSTMKNKLYAYRNIINSCVETIHMALGEKSKSVEFNIKNEDGKGM